MGNRYLFTSESVSEGHPDKLADQISDAVLDACLSGDPHSRVACETFTTTGMVLVGGEITTTAAPNYEELARAVARDVGYTSPAYGLDADSMAILATVHSQSPDISQGVTDGEGLYNEQGAGDQGMMFGYACNETDVYMPLPVTCAHQILLEARRLRHAGKAPWMRPDAKSQVTVVYEDDVPKKIDSVVVSHQHDETVSYDEIQNTVVESVVRPVLEKTGLPAGDTTFYVNPTGRFVVGGPHGDSGLTGRKIIVDTYGGMGRHGGGAFSGKDPSKVDRSAAYMARYVAKNVVAAGLAERAEVGLAYAIGVPFPVSVRVDTFGSGEFEEPVIEAAVREVFDLSPAGIVTTLELLRPIFRQTAAYGHFGRELPDFSWEKADRVEDLRSQVEVEASKGKQPV